MTEKHRDRVVTANWKMYKTIEEATQYINDLIPKLAFEKIKIYIAVPFTAIYPSSQLVKDSKLVIGAQNMSEAQEGAFTGEIAGRMLKNAGAKFVILGHSERRIYFNETNQKINSKLKTALKEQLQPILCIGESLEEREKGNAEKIIEEQLFACLEGLTSEEIKKIIVAYEPIWAIGTGKVAQAEDAQKMHAFCRTLIRKQWGNEVADQIVLQYGGSVKPENAHELMKQEDIDGLLIGGASLSVDSFIKIISSL